VSLEQAWILDEGYDLFATNDVTPSWGVWASHDLISLRDTVILALEAGWDYAGEDEAAFAGQLDTELRTHDFHGGVRIRWAPIDFLQPHVRVVGGVSWVRADLTANGEHSETEELPPFVSAGGGFLLRSPTRSFETPRGMFASLSLGVMVEGGYTHAAALDVGFRGARGERDIALVEPDLGSLDRAGPYVRTSLVASF
jgi:hypothetical protein